jgi:hypothetical protein
MLTAGSMKDAAAGITVEIAADSGRVKKPGEVYGETISRLSISWILH